MARSDFQRYLMELIRARYDTAGELAQRIGLTHSAFSRGLAKGTFSIESLLRLAHEVGESPHTILTRADKPEIADLLKAVYGEPAPRPSPTETRMLRAFRALPTDAQAAWLALAETHPGRKQPADEADGPGRPSGGPVS